MYVCLFTAVNMVIVVCVSNSYSLKTQKLVLLRVLLTRTHCVYP